MHHSFERTRTELAKRLREHRAEIERTTLARAYAISDPDEARDADYVGGLRAAASAALDYGLEGIERGEENAPPVPPILRAQARLAARNGITLDTVLRRYFAGYALLGDFLLEEAQASRLLDISELKVLLRVQATLFDRLLTAVSEEHSREMKNLVESSERRRAERIERLLDGELLDVVGFTYDFDAWHLGVIAAGKGAEDAVGGLGKRLDCRVLLLHRGDSSVWAWFGARRRLDPADSARAHRTNRFSDLAMAFGEPGRGLDGWRITHRQARAALPVALRRPGAPVRYGEVALVAAFLQDDLLATSLRELYFAPLEQARDGGTVAKETLRAYFAADRNVSSAAAALGVRRHTVASRLHSIEEAIGRTLSHCSVELEALLRLDELGDSNLVGIAGRTRPD